MLNKNSKTLSKPKSSKKLTLRQKGGIFGFKSKKKALTEEEQLKKDITILKKKEEQIQRQIGKLKWELNIAIRNFNPQGKGRLGYMRTKEENPIRINKLNRDLINTHNALKLKQNLLKNYSQKPTV